MSDTPCPNLLDLAGDRYKVTYDPAYDPFNVPRDRLDPWMMVLRGRHGEIYPWGAGQLAVFATPTLAVHLRAIPGLTLWTDGSDGKTFTFPVAALDAVARVIRPRKRPQLSPERRQQLAGRMANVRAAKPGPKKNPGTDAPGGPGDPGPVPAAAPGGSEAFTGPEPLPTAAG
jgi:hypothetical protein